MLSSTHTHLLGYVFTGERPMFKRRRLTEQLYGHFELPIHLYQISSVFALCLIAPEIVIFVLLAMFMHFNSQNCLEPSQKLFLRNFKLQKALNIMRKRSFICRNFSMFYVLWTSIALCDCQKDQISIYFYVSPLV